MNTLFDKLSFPVKLMLLGLIPLLFLIYFAFQIIHEKQERVDIVRSVINDISNSSAVHNLASELHMERRFSYGYLLNKTTSAELVLHRGKVDAALATLTKNADTSFRSYLKYSMLNELQNKRTLILSRQLSLQQSLNYYTNVLLRVHSFYNNSVENIPYLQSISADLRGQNLISHLLNKFGALRANIYSTGIKRTFTPQEFEEIQRFSDLTFSYAEEFNTKGSKNIINSFEQVSQLPETKYVNKILLELRTNNKLPDDFNAELWWKNSGVVVDNMLKLQALQIVTTKEKAENILAEENRTLYLGIFLLAAIIVLVISIIFFTIKNITGKLNTLRLAAEKLSIGGSNIQLPVYVNDAIGSLTKSIHKLDQNNLSLATAADAIGRGEFEIGFSPRSNEDTLGHAVVKMKADLQTFTRANQEKLWIQTGLNRIDDTLRGEKSVKDLTNDLLAALIGYLEAHLGILYTCENEVLHLMAGYAITHQHELPQTLKYGETLIGEVAKNRELIYLTDVPEDFVKIVSGAGSAVPRHLLIIPLVHNNSVEGVIELGSFKTFHSAAQQLVQQASNSIAVAIQAARNREKLQELLEETQSQAEELQAQHSELESLNTELEAQALRLQTSEEELKVQQEELLQTNTELEERSRSLEEKNQLIVERNLDIQKKAEELELSTKYKSEFLANMSHELRTPLNSILLLSRLMYENHEKNLTADQVEYARVIQSSGNGLLALIDEILDLSKIESGKMDLEYSEVALTDIASDMKSLFSPIAREKNLSFKVEIAEAVPKRINTDKMRVEQIIKNLVSNALKFTSQGSVKLSVQPTDDPLMIMMSVTDTGIGIPKDKQQQVFEAFQQADGSTQRKFGGTGLGLSISRELARLLGGEISVESEVNKGSIFSLLLPITKIEKPAEKKEHVVKGSESEVIPLAEENYKTKEPRLNLTVNTIPQQIPDDRDLIKEDDRAILIIEDDTNFAKALLNYTRRAGYKGLVAVRGDAGIEMASIYNPIAILLDIQLPIKDGWEVMEELKSNPKTRHIPVHIMSSLEAKRESLVKGAVDFINKPVAIEQMQQMFKKLEDALNKHPKKVLIIEENHQHAQALAYFLQTFSVNSEIKSSVSEGIDTLLKNDTDCVILDMGIPDQNAYETLDNIKKSPGLENLPIIIFTGKSLSKAEEGRLRYYADSIVMKTAHSYQRILDEVAVFLHLVEEKRNQNQPTTSRSLSELTQVLSGKTVLIADDDVRNIFSLTKALEKLKMKVLSAIDGKEALKVLEENPHTDVVLMDMMMPEMDGFESIKQIRKNPRYRNLPILAVTAKAMVGDREKCIQAGASDYISKPVDIDQLISLLRVWLYYKTA